MDWKSLYEENKNNIIILAIIIVVVIVFFSIFSGKKSSKNNVLEVKFSDTAVQIEENKTYQVKYTVLPSTIEDDTLIWTSTDDSIASVDENGLISAYQPGSVIIVGKAASGANDNLDVTVVEQNRDNTSVKFDIENFDLKITTSRRLYPVFTPTDLSYSSILWSSSNDLVATVTQSGMVSGVKTGKAVITATVNLNDGTYLTTSSNVTVTSKTTLSLSSGSSVSVDNGNSKVLTLVVSDEEVVVKQIVGETSNNNIVQIIRRPLTDDDGNISLTIKALGVGKATLNFNMETMDGEIVTLSVPVTVK